ncbi:hypothetical protein CORC01_14498 [Colletotrichum orchidophilum]|uniref:Uncharacterized protein n=1 Tax=Colletotrichum orchidophilum TaxID=1209926 RepID=A0A1G4AM54_9PEZI|nr:uncharacterized protein CORC01_14498 [Colletotrichum orchidophilum]OHE90211.1 hypothetical protein CORC01_14498 [Colletotrichum orchidophilum]
MRKQAAFERTSVNDGVDATNLESHDTSDDVVAVLVYVATKAKGERIQNEGIVLFADDDLDAVVAGEYAEVTGIWLYPVQKEVSMRIMLV